MIVLKVMDGKASTHLKGHKASVTSSDVSSDGTRFASADCDGTVIIWKSNGEGVLKYSHTGAVRAVSFNPSSKQLASGGHGDIGLWSFEKRSVDKVRVPSPVWCLKWSPDGERLYAGLLDGSVVEYDRPGTEKSKCRNLGSVCWCLEVGTRSVVCGLWSTDSPTGLVRILNVASDRTGLSQSSTDIRLDYQPTSVVLFSDQLILVTGTAGRIDLVSGSHGRLLTVYEGPPDVWILSMALQGSQLVFSSATGEVTCLNLSISTVHGLHRDLYAHRNPDSLTDVCVTDLLSGSRTNIYSKSLVKKVSLYMNRVAVQSPDTVVIYSLPDCAPIARFPIAGSEVSLLLMAAMHLVICRNDRLVQLLTLTGIHHREWTLDAPVRYMKVLDGPAGRESMIGGLGDGSVVLLYLDRPVPRILLATHSITVRCVDLSMDKALIAVVDDASVLTIHDIRSDPGNPVNRFTAPGVVSAVWSLTHPSLLVYSSADGRVSVVSAMGSISAHRQAITGTVLGFTKNQVFLLANGKVTCGDSCTVDLEPLLPVSLSRGVAEAFRIASQGVSPDGWRSVGIEALKAKDLSIARKSFAQISEYRMLDLIRFLQDTEKSVSTDAYVLASLGLFEEAAERLVQTGHKIEAADLLIDMRRWKEYAALFSGQSDQLTAAIHRLKLDGFWGDAGDACMAVGDVSTAWKFFIQADAADAVMRCVHRSHDLTTLEAILDYFTTAGEDSLIQVVRLRIDELHPSSE